MEHTNVEAALQAAAVIAAAAALGTIISRRMPIPLPVVLLAVGLVLGSDGFGIVKTQELDDLTRIIIVLSVAIIVFEGGTALDLAVIRSLGGPVRNLVVLGLIITPVVGAIAANVFLGFGWRVSFLFGALVAVTGPSVITPLLRAVRVNDRLRSILMAEGVIIDPFGALLTFFLLQLALSPEIETGGPTAWVIERVVTGIAVGAAGAAIVWAIPRFVRRLSGGEMGLLTLSAAVAAFGISESIAFESGLTAMVVMGIAIGSLDIPHKVALHQFHSSILTFLIAAVYVLLAASISFDALRNLWPEGLAVVAALILVGRPLLVFASTFRSELTTREKLFLSAVGPRGVVAASLAGVVAVEAGGLVDDEARFVAMVFVVIAVTIGLQSAYANPLSRLLGVQPMITVIAGCGTVGRAAALKLQNGGERVLLVDSDEQAVIAAREAGFDVVLGDIAKAETLRKLDLKNARAFVLATPSDDRNLLAAQLARSTYGHSNLFARVSDPDNQAAFQDLGVVVVNTAEAVADELAALVSDPVLSELVAPVDSDMGVVRVTVTNADAQRAIQSTNELAGTLVVMVRRGTQRVIPNGRTRLRLGDVVTMFGTNEGLQRARRFLAGEIPPE